MGGLKIGHARVHHARSGKSANTFRYSVFNIFFSSRDEGLLQEFFKARFRNLISFSSSDYLEGKPEPLDQGMRRFLTESFNFEADEIVLQTMPRIFGYVFNPVSFWYCSRGGNLEAVLVEVNNTFGERHFYWIHPPGGVQETQWYHAEKCFHVSPFLPIEGHYRFQFARDDKAFKVVINLHGEDDKLKLTTSIRGEVRDLESFRIRDLILQYGWMTVLVVIRIHAQAMMLWSKKARFYAKPNPPTARVTYSSSNHEHVDYRKKYGSLDRK